MAQQVGNGRWWTPRDGVTLGKWRDARGEMGGWGHHEIRDEGMELLWASGSSSPLPLIFLQRE